MNEQIFKVTRNGKEVHPNLYDWDEKKKIFTTQQSGLLLSFKKWSGITFVTGDYCIFDTGSFCKFKTGHACIFNTIHYCIFDTGSGCIFDTGRQCEFATGGSCTFNTGGDCTFKTGVKCVFKTGGNCVFDTGKGSVIIDREKETVIRLDEQRNYYNMKHHQIRSINNVTVFKYNDKVVYDLNIRTEDIGDLKPFLSEEDYSNLLLEVFKNMI